MAGFLSKAQDFARFALDGHSKWALQAVSYRLYGNDSSVGLHRDLSKTFEIPSAKLQIVIRPLRPDDDLAFLHSGGDEDDFTQFVQLRQLRMIKLNLPTCYVAVAPQGDICYMQWLIPATENEKIQANFSGQFPLLHPDEALLEGAYTAAAYRGRGIMASAMGQIAEKAKQFGARWAITFVGLPNEPSVKGCMRAGFEPYISRRQSWRMLHRSTKFVPISRPSDSRVAA
jgi:GNAT superfamily N-acetyltransferase